MKRKKNKKLIIPKVAEPDVDYTKSITIATPDELAQRNRELTSRMTPAERMAYLLKLNENVFGTDLSEQIKIFKEGRIFFKSSE